MRTTTLILSLPLLAAPAVGQGERGDAVRQSNILLIVADDLGVDHVGVYKEGTDPAPTPTIDQLAENGLLFRNAYSNPVCSPTRAQLMTGRYGLRTGIGVVLNHNGWALQPQELTLPEVLRMQSSLEHCGAFGKWHLGNPSVGGNYAPNLAGWTHFAGAPGNFLQGEDYYDWVRVVNGVAGKCTQYATSANVDDALRWIRSVSEPWMCYIAFNAPHSPLHKPPPELHTVELPRGEPRNTPVPHYRAMVEAMDTEMQRLFEGLGEAFQRTTVIFVGDNGTPKHATVPPWDRHHAKGTPYEGGINVPLIIAGPEVVQPGREVAALVNTTDIFATCLDLARVSPVSVGVGGTAADSISLKPYLQDPNAAPLREFAYAELFTPNNPTGLGVDHDWRIIRDKRYKLITFRGAAVENRVEFYDLQNDPLELNDLASRPTMSIDEHQAREALLARLNELLQEAGN